MKNKVDNFILQILQSQDVWRAQSDVDEEDVYHTMRCRKMKYLSVNN